MITGNHHDFKSEFELKPFDSKTSGEIVLNGKFFQGKSQASFCFSWEGFGQAKVQDISQGTTAPKRFQLASSTRRDELWKSTCFELFLMPSIDPLSKKYFEVNLAAMGFWNIYEFESERTGMKPSQNLAGIEFSNVYFQFGPSFCELHLDLKENELALSARFGLSAVIKMPNEISYWAMTHKKNKPDFHDQNSWMGMMHV